MSKRIGFVVVSVMTLWFLTACGATTTTSANSGEAPTVTVTTTTQATATAVAASGVMNGCPSQHAPSNTVTKPPDVVATQGKDPSGQPVTLKMGQTLEIHLPAASHWGLSQQSSNGILAEGTPDGWYDASQQMCVWRFTAVKSGTTSLAFTGEAVCAPNSKCPTYARAEEFDVTVQ